MMEHFAILIVAAIGAMCAIAVLICAAAVSSDEDGHPPGE